MRSSVGRMFSSSVRVSLCSFSVSTIDDSCRDKIDDGVIRNVECIIKLVMIIEIICCSYLVMVLV